MEVMSKFYIFICTKPDSTCGIYSQLSSIIKPSNHILKSSKVIFNETVVKKCAVLAAI